MNLKGTFNRVVSQKTGLPMYSFTLRNTALLYAETVDCLIRDATGSKTRTYRELKVHSRGEVIFNEDTCGWNWCRGDSFCILGRRDKVQHSWTFSPKEYAPGECPECHGTQACRHCGGQGYLAVLGSPVQRCPHCGGTGTCQTCYIPVRRSGLYRPGADGVSSPVSGSSSAATIRRSRSAAEIQMDIANVQAQLSQVEWDLKRMELDGNHSHTLYTTQLQLRYKYQERLSRLQQELLDAIR